MKHYYDVIHNGQPIGDVEIVDMHAHLGEYFNMHIPNARAESMIHIMDRCGIDKTILSTTVGISSDFVLGNNVMLEAIRKYRHRLYGACLVNGNYPSLSIQELERCFNEDKAVVLIKIHPILTKCKLEDKRMDPIYEFAQKNEVPILVHTWLDQDDYGNLDMFARVAKAYLKINWIMGHSGGPYGSFKAVEIAKQFMNVYLDITLSMCPARQIEFFVNEVGSERILFGSDNPFIDPRPQIGRVGLAEISQEDRINIFAANARRLVHIE